MDVTKHNFFEELDDILKAIDESTFLAVDSEFTGLDAEGCSHNGPFDTPAERYAKLKNGSTDFLLMQFGLCAFKLDEEKQTYEAKPYNFYLFPSPPHRHAPDRRFLCQSSSIDFLVSHGFDFNKVFREGIPYLSAQQEDRLKSDLEQRHKDQRAGNHSVSAKDKADIPENQREFIKGICEKIDAHLKEDSAEPLEIRNCDGFQRKLIYQTVEEKYPLAHVKTQTAENKERYLVLYGAKDNEELAKKDRERQALEMMELDNQVGFTKVFQAIAKSGKLVVGHNMFLDVLHSFKHFHGPLPDDVDDFKSAMESVLPKIIDTKLMANTLPLKEYIDDSSLGNMHQILQSKPFSPVTINAAPGHQGYDLGNEQLHEAGFDAFVTGSCFAAMCKFLGKCQNPPTDFLHPSSPVIEAFVNKLYLMRIVDIQYLNLAGPNPELNRDHVFHVTFPKEWRSSDLYSLFEPYGDVKISWLTNTTAYVGLLNKKYAKIAYDALTQESGSFHVTSYAFHHRNETLRLASAGKRKNPGESDPLPSKMKRQSAANQNCPDERGDTSLERSAKKPAVMESSRGAAQSGDQAKAQLFEESADW